VEDLTFQERRESLWKNQNPDDIRKWLNEAIKPDTQGRQDYRIQGADIDDDVARGAEFYRKTLCGDREYAMYVLRLMWRFLLRDYALCEACHVGRVLKDWGEPWHWRWWRGLSLLLPRLGIAIFAGFLILSSSSGLISLINAASRPEHRGWLIGLPVAAAIIVYGFSVGEVQQRLGRRPWGVILFRGAMVAAIGAAYAAAGGVIQYFGARSLCIAASPAFCALCAAAALVLGFVLQLFWQDRSIAEPL
jgi:hypothetical protein